jgi:hypothetical protein
LEDLDSKAPDLASQGANKSVSSHVCRYMTYTMTIYLAQPILCLVGIVKSISDKTLTDELPLLQGGSCEIHDVYDSLEKLCKIVRFSNAAYFKGDRTKSYKVLQEALDLFVKMGNQKGRSKKNCRSSTLRRF